MNLLRDKKHEQKQHTCNDSHEINKQTADRFNANVYATTIVFRCHIALSASYLEFVHSNMPANVSDKALSMCVKDIKKQNQPTRVRPNLLTIG